MQVNPGTARNSFILKTVIILETRWPRRCAFTGRRSRLLAIPSIDLEEGRAVKRIRGVRGTGIVLGDPLDYAYKLYSVGFKTFHIVDLDGAERGQPLEAHLEIAELLTRDLDVCVQYGGGVRSVEVAEEVCSAGAVPVIGSAWLVNASILDDVYSLCGHVIAAIDHYEGTIVFNAWSSKSRVTLDDALRILETRRLSGYLMTSVAPEGTLEGPDVASLRRARSLTGRPIEYSGGIASIADLETLEDAGADAAIIGMALASGLLDPREVASRYG